jgi:hypothetical protein
MLQLIVVETSPDVYPGGGSYTDPDRPYGGGSISPDQGIIQVKMAF